MKISMTMLVALAIVTSGCGGYGKRPPRTPEQLLTARVDSDAQAARDGREMVKRVIQRTKREYDDYLAKRRPDAPVIDILIVSGGGDWGAFGAGFLKGWLSVPSNDPLAKPDFDAVTGVSTGALIAPFAFLGDEASLQCIEQLYRNPKKDWVKQRGPLYFMPNNISFAEVPGLERELKKNVTAEMIRQIADKGADGHVLAVNTTNVDDGMPRVFDLVAEAQRAVENGNTDRIRDVMLASAGIPGAFPFRVIDGVMYVDGGVTGNIIYGGRLAEDASFTAQWHAAHPDLPIPKSRYWVIFNNQFRPAPVVTDPTWPAVVTRSLETSTRAATLTALRHLMAMTEISRLKRKAEIEVRIVCIPGEWVPPKPGVFIKETMNDLVDMGMRMGADAGSWKTELRE